MNIFQDLLIGLGRICISVLFIWAGLAKVWNWKGTVAYMQSKNVPAAAWLLPLVALIQIIGGFSLALGFQTRIGAVLLIAFIIPSAIKMHDFWRLTGNERATEKTLFMKDIAILGGLLLLLVTGSGLLSFDGR